MQPEIDFTSQSPINRESLGKQNRLIYDYLMVNDTINMTEAVKLGIYSFHSRICELRKKVTLFERFVKVGETTCKEISLKEFNNATH